MYKIDEEKVKKKVIYICVWNRKQNIDVTKTINQILGKIVICLFFLSRIYKLEYSNCGEPLVLIYICTADFYKKLIFICQAMKIFLTCSKIVDTKQLAMVTTYLYILLM